jgi:hypothetical protein
MAKEIDLDALIPDDLEFIYRGKTYSIPGDVDTETVLRMFRMFQLLLETRDLAQGAEDQDAKKFAAKIDKAYDEINSILLTLFQVNHPQLESLPFGVAAMPHVIAGVLELLGVTGDPQTGERSEESTTSPPKKPKQSVPRKRASAAKARSPRSSG